MRGWHDNVKLYTHILATTRLRPGDVDVDGEMKINYDVQ